MTVQGPTKETFAQKLSGWLAISFVFLLIAWAPSCLILVLAGNETEAKYLTVFMVTLWATIFYYIPLIAKLRKQYSISLLLRLIIFLLPTVLIIYGIIVGWI